MTAPRPVELLCKGLATGLFFTACSPATHPSSGGPSTSHPANESAKARAEPLSVDPRTLVDVERAEVSACSLTPGQQPATTPLPLRLGPSNPPFTRVDAPRFADFELATESDAARAHVVVGRVHLVGWVSSDDVALYPGAQLRLQGIFLPKGVTRLSWRGVEPGLVEVSLYEPLGENALGTRVSCSAVALEPSTLPEPTWASPSGESTFGSIGPGHVVLAAQQTGEGPVDVDVGESRLAVRALEKRDGRVHVVAQLPSGWLDGWVLARDLTPSKSPLAFELQNSITTYKHRARDVAFEPSECEAGFTGLTLKRACDHPLGVLARIGKTTRRVGWIEPDELIGVGREHPTFPEYATVRELELPGILTSCHWKKPPADPVVAALDSNPGTPPRAPSEAPYFAELLVDADAVGQGCAERN
ncbi:MAG: hypothetical protein U0271_05565 [Polyangiaceae bacterium]